MNERAQGNLPDLQEILHTLIIELMGAGGTNGYGVAWSLCSERPDIVERYGSEQIEALADKMLKSELAEFSLRFQRMFDSFNCQYFGGRLRRYRVRVMYDAGWIRLSRSSRTETPTSGVIDFRRRTIKIRLSESEADMTEILLHEMAHASTNGFHGIKWTLEMIRLREAGAPIREDQTWGVGGQVWRIIEKAGVGRTNSVAIDGADSTFVSEYDRLIALGCTRDELQLLVALHLIGPNRSQHQIDAVQTQRELEQRPRSLKKRRHR